MPLQYRPLDPLRSENRLITMQAGKGLDSMTLHLRTVSLDDNPRYHALSYVLGNPSNLKTIATVNDGSGRPITLGLHTDLKNFDDTYTLTVEDPQPEHIIIDNEDVSITRNLAMALYSLRGHYSKSLDSLGQFFIWVDAICIDQKDSEEKARQIPLMGRIYSSAMVVFAYLGPGDDQIALAINTLEQILPHLEVSLEQDEPDLDWIENFPQIWSMDEVDMQGENDFWAGVRRLFSLPFWRRAWILQELALSGMRVIFFTGATANRTFGFPTIMLWDKFMTRMRTLRDIKRPACSPYQYWARVSAIGASACVPARVAIHLVLKRHHNPENWKMKTLREFCDASYTHVATNPKDKIYALMNLMELDLPVGYTDRLTVESLYIYFACRFLEANQESHVMACSGIGKCFTTRRPLLPSWVPDWDAIFLEPLDGGSANPYQLGL
jgi:hypothetical protein